MPSKSPHHMTAAVLTAYGDAQNIKLVSQPTPEPKDNEVLIRVVSSTVNSADWRLRTLNVPTGFGPLVRLYMGLLRPRKKILGTELSGQVVAVGRHVTRFAPHDDVVAFTGSKLGAHAEYVALRESIPIIPKPQTLDWNEAAAMSFGGTTAVDFLLNKGSLREHESVLINGASGVVGSAAIQIARHAGARVTAVCSHDAAEQARRLGAEQVIDYHETDFSQSGQQWDVILDAVGNAGWSRAKNSLRPNGRLLLVVTDLMNTLGGSVMKGDQGQRCIVGTARESREDLAFLAELANSGAYHPEIHTVHPFAQVQQAHRELDKGHKRGSVIVRVAEPRHRVA